MFAPTMDFSQSKFGLTQSSISFKLEVSENVESEKVTMPSLVAITSKWTHFLKSNILCDACIRTEDGEEFYLHRVILATSSEFFRAAFTHPFGGSVVNVHLPATTFRLIINYFYHGFCNLTLEKAETLWEAAEMLCSDELIEAVIQFLKNKMSFDTCLEIYQLTKKFNSSHELKHCAVECIKYNFGNLAKSGVTFEDFSLEEMEFFLQSDDTNVRDEAQVVQIIAKWVQADENNRVSHIGRLMKSIREPMTLVYKGITYEVNISYFDHFFSRLPRDIIFVFGGWPDSEPTAATEFYDCRCKNWQYEYSTTDEPPRAYHGMVFVNNCIHVIGGFDGTYFLRTHRKLDLYTKKWSKCDTMFRKRCYVSVVVLGNYIYAIGGFNGEIRYKSCERYDLKTNRWEFIASTREEHSDAAAVVHNGKIYVAGGFTGLHVLNSIEEYDETTNTWRLIGTMLTPRSGLSTVVLNNKIYFLGGYDGRTRLNSVETWDPGTRDSAYVQSLLLPKSNFAAVVFHDEIWILGGYNEEYHASNLFHLDKETMQDVESYNPKEGVWVSRATICQGKSALTAAVLKNVPNPQNYQSGWYEIPKTKQVVHF